MAVDASGNVEVWASNKGPFALKNRLAQDLGIEPEKVNVHILSVGGDFGGKASMIDTPVCYFLAKETGRPVRLVLTYTEEIATAAHRHPAVVTLRAGVKNDGTLTAIDGKVTFAGGAYAAWKANPEITVLGAKRLASYYRVPAIRIETVCAYTNQVPCTQTRTPGSPQIVFAVESQMGHMAREMGIDPVDFRLRNLPGPRRHVAARGQVERHPRQRNLGEGRRGIRLAPGPPRTQPRPRHRALRARRRRRQRQRRHRSG